MKGNETRLVEFMDGSKKRFVIPVYQRNYDWKQENCKQLFDDLVKVEKGGRTFSAASFPFTNRADGRLSSWWWTDSSV